MSDPEPEPSLSELSNSSSSSLHRFDSQLWLSNTENIPFHTPTLRVSDAMKHWNVGHWFQKRFPSSSDALDLSAKHVGTTDGESVLEYASEHDDISHVTMQGLSWNDAASLLFVKLLQEKWKNIRTLILSDCHFETSEAQETIFDGISKLKKLVSLDLTNVGMNGVEGAKSVSSMLSSMSSVNSLRVLSLGLNLFGLDSTGHSVSEEAFGILSNGLTHVHRVAFLDLGGTSMLASGLQVLFDAKCLHQLTALNVKGNELEANGATIINRLLLENSLLAFLNLRRNRLRRSGVYELSEGVAKSSSLLVLNMQQNDLGDLGFVAFARRGLQENSSLLQLNICDNDLGPQSAQALVDVLSDNICQIKILNIEKNHLGEQGGKYLATALEGNISLDSIFLGDNAFANSGVMQLARELGKFHSLKTISLRNNFVEPNAAWVLESQLQPDKNTCLEYLNLGNNLIGDEGAFAIASMIRKNPYLKRIDIRGNSIGDPGILEIADALRSNTTLGTLCLQANNFRVELCVNVLDATMHSPRPCRIQFDPAPVL